MVSPLVFSVQCGMHHQSARSLPDVSSASKTERAGYPPHDEDDGGSGGGGGGGGDDDHKIIIWSNISYLKSSTIKNLILKCEEIAITIYLSFKEFTFIKVYLS